MRERAIETGTTSESSSIGYPSPEAHRIGSVVFNAQHHEERLIVTSQDALLTRIRINLLLYLVGK